jgi:nucleoside-diphosphate-sugar epimerase
MEKAMRVFITGGTGFVGSGVIRELIAAGHAVTGLARTSEGIDKLTAAGVTAKPGDLTDLATLRAAAADADAVVHCGFSHDFSKHMEAIEMDRNAIGALLDGLGDGSGPKVFVGTFGTAGLPAGRVGTELDAATGDLSPRGLTERLVLAAADRGVRSAVLRLPPSVHGPADKGFVPMLMDLARKTGVAAYLGAGDNRWPAVHRDDAAALYRLAVEKLADGSLLPGFRLHAVGDAGVPFRDIAGAIADQLKLGPAEPRGADHFGWFARFAAIDNPVSAAITERETGWRPTRPGLLADVRGPAYGR